MRRNTAYKMQMQRLKKTAHLTEVPKFETILHNAQRRKATCHAVHLIDKGEG